MEYDLIRLFEHPVYFADFVAPTIVTFEEGEAARRTVGVEWRLAAGDAVNRSELILTWDLDALRAVHPLIDRHLASVRERDENRARRTEVAAVVAVAVMSLVEPATRFTRVAETGSRHDYFLNGTKDEMIEVAGLWEGGLPGLFEEKRRQSDGNPGRRRWVSVTVFREATRNRTEGLHP
ncbi:MAG: hypothetical protein K2X82_06410 [Gemmataceae bacterium]|nr:hypothetical protein [Gemmataceae bacterium]